MAKFSSLLTGVVLFKLPVGFLLGREVVYPQVVHEIFLRVYQILPDSRILDLAEDHLYFCHLEAGVVTGTGSTTTGFSGGCLMRIKMIRIKLKLAGMESLDLCHREAGVLLGTN